MSHIFSSLALDESKEQTLEVEMHSGYEPKFDLIINARHMSMNSSSSITEIGGRVTVSF